MSGDLIKVDRDGRLTIITINRPDARNALNAAAQREMAAAMDAFAEDDDQWVVIVTGAGDKAFCAGHDLKQQAESGDMFTPTSGFGGLTARDTLTKPVIVAANGPAFGGGFEMVLAADIVVAVESAFFALPEPLVGLAALAGGIQRLPRIVGTTRAMGMLLTGRRVPAREALEMGLVNEVAQADVLAAACRWADQIIACSPMSIRATKQAVRHGEALGALDAMQQQWSLSAIRAMLASHDAIEGPRAFAEKRKPDWQGR